MTGSIDPEPVVETCRLEPNGGFPNNPSLPLLLYRGALREPVPGEVEALLGENRWAGSWRNGVYGFDHFHSNAHEVLCCCAGSARVRFGGPGGPVIHVEAGDVAILPAGTGHGKEASSADFLVVGAYPLGQERYDMMRGDLAQAEQAAANIAAVPPPARDPIYGTGGPLLLHWAAPDAGARSG